MDMSGTCLGAALLLEVYEHGTPGPSCEDDLVGEVLSAVFCLNADAGCLVFAEKGLLERTSTKRCEQHQLLVRKQC